MCMYIYIVDVHWGIFRYWIFLKPIDSPTGGFSSGENQTNRTLGKRGCGARAHLEGYTHILQICILLSKMMMNQWIEEYPCSNPHGEVTNDRDVIFSAFATHRVLFRLTNFRTCLKDLLKVFDVSTMSYIYILIDTYVII